jgi:hypothetical protein
LREFSVRPAEQKSNYWPRATRGIRVKTLVSHSARYGAIKAKLNHEGREEHEGQASQHEG